MKITHTMLIATTALGLSMSMAYADEGNKAYLNQSGTANSALVDQSGGGSNLAGRAAQFVTQAGDDNTLTILQSGIPVGTAVGSQNKFGVSSNGTSGKALQTGSYNVLNAEQNGFKNWTVNVLQTAPGGLSGPSNVATIKQLGNYGGINTVTQSSAVASTSVMNTATLTQTGGNSAKIYMVDQKFTGASGDTGNYITIYQNGGTHNVGTARQLGYDNVIDISQTGGRTNKVTLANQAGNGNTSKLYFTGNFNGESSLPHGSFALMSGAASSTSDQTGTGNDIDFMATGDRNNFGFYQNGTSNSVGLITVTGNDNALGIWQDGDTNIVDIGTIAGSRNDVGVRQDGTNRAQIDLTNSSDDNQVWVDQIGTNTAAKISIDGDSNRAEVTQDGSNSADIRITGNFNNNSSLTTWGGFAATVLGSSHVGLMTQSGAGNDLDVTVLGDNNLWATEQVGPGNTILAMVDGHGNQFAVSQTSTTTGNNATFSQTGKGNNIGVSQ
ncbi:beta strand repeat-containing protein [Hoeflea sp.]|uniref:beta strand repeat-containing protein n=1 Tax=Hoeflea sp. TaxID=1940281 RepID=UPI003A8EE513